MPRSRLSLLLVAALAAPLAAQTKKVLTVDDYSRWRSISNSAISSDGKWVTYVLAQTNTAPADAKPVLHILRLDNNQDIQVPNGGSPAFSPDAKWIAYEIDSSASAGRGRGRGAGANNGPPGAQTPSAGANATATRRVELRNLASGAVQSWRDMQAFTFSSNSDHLLLRRRAPAPPAGAGRGGAPGAPAAPPGGNASGAEPTGPRGADVILHDLTTGHDELLGSVADAAFNKAGDLLAYDIDASVRDGNGLFLVDLHSNRITPLDNDAKVYNRLSWSDDGTGLAVLKGSEVDKERERENVLLVYPHVRSAFTDAEAAPVTLDPSKTSAFPRAWVISDRAPVTWSADDKRVFFGAKEQSPAADTSNRRRGPDEVADVDVWNTKDDRIQSMQMIRADADRNFAYREALDVGSSKFVLLADSTMRDLEVARKGKWAVGRDARAYVSDYRPAAADFYRVNTETGERTLMFKDQLTGPEAFGIAPDGDSYLYWKDNRFQTYDLNSTATRALGGTVAFTDFEYDHPGPKPSYGISGYTSDGKGFLAINRYDTWLVPLDGSAPKDLTNGVGAKNEIRFRYVRFDPDTSAPEGAAPGAFGGGRAGGAPRTIDLSKPITFSAYGEYTKKDGFYERSSDGQLNPLIYEDASFGTPRRAAKADVYLFTRETFVEFPDLRVAGSTLKDSRKITEANPQQAEYNWGHRVLFDFALKDGTRAQGILAIPDDYKPGEKRPMIVNFYEKNSQNLHHYSAPTFLASMGSSPIEAVSKGYLTMLPDVYFHTGRSHSDMLEAVEAATKKVIEMGYADPKHIGINGHSYGGEGVAFIGTRSRMFAAVGMGAGVTDLYQDFNQNWGWAYQVTGGSGANGDEYYIYGQGRWGFSPWERPDVYMFESALTHVPEITAPFLIMHGTADPTVAFQNGLGFYNAMRFNGKNAVLLAYIGEGHGLRGLANRRDLTIRFFQFFDHYLKGAPAPAWMTQGVPFLLKEAMRDPGSDAGVVTQAGSPRPNP